MEIIISQHYFSSSMRELEAAQKVRDEADKLYTQLKNELSNLQEMVY